jgi:hypothetical protein
MPQSAGVTQTAISIPPAGPRGGVLWERMARRPLFPIRRQGTGTTAWIFLWLFYIVALVGTFPLFLLGTIIMSMPRNSGLRRGLANQIEEIAYVVRPASSLPAGARGASKPGGTVAGMTTERWQQLNAKLEAEVQEAEAKLSLLKARAARFAGLFLLALAVPFAAAGVAWGVGFAQFAEVGALCVPLPVLCAWLWIAAGRKAGVQQAEFDRVSHDKRAWRRQKPTGA